MQSPDNDNGSRPIDDRPKRRVALVLILAVWLVTVAANAPGHLSNDSVVQLGEGRWRAFAGGHPPLMSLLMGWTDGLLPGTALYLLLSSSFFFGALILLVASAPRVTAPMVAFLAAFLLTPLVLVYQGIIWKDVLFANLSLFSFVLIVSAADRGGKLRYGAWAVALFTAAVAGQIRQNGVVIVVFCALATATWRYSSNGLWRPLVASVTGRILLGLAVFATVSFVSAQVVRLSAREQPGNSLSWGVWVVARYDLAGMLARGAQDTAALKQYGVELDAARADARAHYAADRIDGLNAAVRYGTEMDRIPPANLSRVWMEMVLANPASYLAHRLAVLRWMVWPPDVGRCLPVHVGVSGPADLMAKLQLQDGQRPADRVLFAYSQQFFGTPLFCHGAFLAASGVLLVVLVRFPSNRRHVAASLILSSFAFAISFGLIALACDFRYLYFVPLAFAGASLVAMSEALPRSGQPSRAGHESLPTKLDQLGT